MTLRPELAGRLIIGGLPRSRFPLVLGLLGVTVVLVVTAIVLLRREHELARLRGDFVASVSHELRTPLAQIRMFTETLRLGRVRSEVERSRSLEILDQETRRLSHLVDNLLYVARGERNRLQLHPEEIDLGLLLHQVVEGFVPIAAARRMTVTSAIADGVPARVDPGALRQVVLNLLDNAVKYAPAGSAVVVRLDADPEQARISVEDAGPGVPPGMREKIWQRFARLDRDVQSAVAGSGIGLAIVRELVTAQGGRCRVEDAPGGGSALRRGAAAMTRVLVVEDNLDLAYGLRNNLEIEGYEVSVAEDGTVGLARAVDWRPDLVILDLTLPGLDGFRVLKALRDTGHRVPVLILTARDAEADKVRGLKLGADDYVTKPFGVLELLARVEALLRRGRPAGADPAPLRFGHVTVDTATRSVLRNGVAVALAPKELDLLLALGNREGRVVSRAELMREVWGYQTDVLSRTVDTHVAELRRKLEEDPAHPAHILTVRKAGYRLAL